MSVPLYEFDNRTITDQGEVIAHHNLLVELVLSGKSLHQYRTPSGDPDVEMYNRGSDTPIDQWKPDDQIEGPDASCYNWNIPESYLNLDARQLCRDILDLRGLNQPQYQDRLELEFERIEQRGMWNFIRALIYLIDRFRETNTVWGVGRGSSCASLVLFLLGVNRVDPVLYDIPLEEFYK